MMKKFSFHEEIIDIKNGPENGSSKVLGNKELIENNSITSFELTSKSSSSCLKAVQGNFELWVSYG